MISKFKKSKWTSTVLAMVLITSIGFLGLTGCKLSTYSSSNNNSAALSSTDTKDKTTATDSSATSTTSKAIDNPSVYKSTKLNLSIDFPASWSSLYTVKETDKGLYVYFAPAPEGQGLFFCILKKTGDLNENFYDSIDGKKELTVNGITYFLGAPTDIALSEDNSEFKTFTKLKAQVPAVVKSIKGTLPNTNTTKSPDSTKEVFYGDWIIKKLAAYGTVGTYTSEDVKALQGKSLRFSSAEATCFGDQASTLANVVTNPVYKKTTISKSDFETNYRVTFDKLGVTATAISQVTVTDSKGNGCTFFIKDTNTLILYGGGTFLELARKTN